jgi:hypothetical protein
MSLRMTILWALSLVVIVVLTAAAQRPAPDRELGAAGAMVTEAPAIISGPDLGFRIERTQNGIPVGKLVVRIDGRWVDTGSPTTVVPVRR